MNLTNRSKTAIVWSCGHATPETDNVRFDWLGALIHDIKPDYCVDLGDGADMKSLNSFDTKKPGNMVMQNYERDIDSYNESQDLLRYRFKQSKRRRPFWIGFEGNHETRIKTALGFDPRLSGDRYGISFNHLQTSRWFDEYYEYENGAPAIGSFDGVDYAHWMGNYTPTSGINHARTLLTNRFKSSTVGHSHLRNMAINDGAGAIGLVVGCYKGADEKWAGQANLGWWKGVIIKRNIKDGMYDPQFVSLETLRKEYGS